MYTFITQYNDIGSCVISISSQLEYLDRNLLTNSKEVILYKLHILLGKLYCYLNCSFANESTKFGFTLILCYIDHDECKGNVHGCEQQCLNLPGGYNCTCSSGYRLNVKDFKKCDGNVFYNLQLRFILMFAFLKTNTRANILLLIVRFLGVHYQLTRSVTG